MKLCKNQVNLARRAQCSKRTLVRNPRGHGLYPGGPSDLANNSQFGLDSFFCIFFFFSLFVYICLIFLYFFPFDIFSPEKKWISSNFKTKNKNIYI
jgi:hypothetical protein